MDSLSKVPDSLIYEKTTYRHGLSNFFWRVAEAVPELNKATFECGAHAQKTEIYKFALESALCVRETGSKKKKKFLRSFPERALHP